MGHLTKIDLSSDRLTRIHEAVGAGDYSSADAIVDEALRLWERSRDEEIKRARELIDEGRAGPFEPWEGADAIIADARAEFEAEQHTPYRAA